MTEEIPAAAGVDPRVADSIRGVIRSLPEGDYARKMLLRALARGDERAFAFVLAGYSAALKDDTERLMAERLRRLAPGAPLH